MTRLREIDNEDLERLFSWRNSSFVRKNMFNSQKISLAEHIKWFSEIRDCKSYRALIYEINNNPSGYMSFRKCEHIWEWGFYKNPSIKQSIGYEFGLAGIRYAKNNLNIKYLEGNVKSENQSSINFHLKLGFYMVSSYKTECGSLKFRLKL